MTESMQDMGNRLVEAGATVLHRDARNALNEQDYNMVVRRAQEAVELTLKGALKMLGADTIPEFTIQHLCFQNKCDRKWARWQQKHSIGSKTFLSGSVRREHLLSISSEATARKTHTGHMMMESL